MKPNFLQGGSGGVGGNLDILKQALLHTKSILFILSQNESHYHVILSLPSATNHCVDVIVVC